jgi:hypothetical protein
VIVINDGSSDSTPQIVAEYDVKLISTENRGLSAARNTGWQTASGEIVAYIDDDAYPDPHWLHYIAYRFMTGDWVGVGGPNIAPPGDGPIADCVANAPGGPVHVLVTDTEAEHIPGCNMAFRREALAAIGGFDPRYRTAGDDVDVCWRLQERGGRIGFHAGAMDWHHRRNSMAMYWRQQKGYGKAEALLEEKWPERYNPIGHFAGGGDVWTRFRAADSVGTCARLRWRVGIGRISVAATSRRRRRCSPSLDAGVALHDRRARRTFAAGPCRGRRLLWAAPLLAVGAGGAGGTSGAGASRAQFPVPAGSPGEKVQRWLVTFYLHMIQPWRGWSDDSGTV